MSSSPPQQTAGCTARPLRADARRNRAALLEAAQALFAEKGMDAGMDEVARRAGVGVGTLYRHFPTKQDLAVAVVIGRIEALVSMLAEGGADPVERLVDVGCRGCAVQAESLLLAEVISPGGEKPPAVRDAVDRLFAGIEALARAAQDQGLLRADVRPEDVSALLCAVGRSAAPGDAEGMARLVNVVMDGLRPAAAAPGPPAAPAARPAPG